MRIQVASVANSEGPLVDCETPVGRLQVHWRGAPIPHCGESYDVELDAVGDLAWGENVNLAAEVQRVEQSAVLVGTIESIDGEIVILRMGGSLLLVEVSGQAPHEVVGQVAFVRPRRIDAWPTGI